MERFILKPNFEKIYSSNNHIVIARIMIALRCQKELAEDLSIKVFIKVAKYLPTFDANKSNFNTWMNMLVTNVMIDYKRSKEGKMKFRTSNIEDKVNEEGEVIFNNTNSADTMADVNLGLSELETLLKKTLASFSELKQKVCVMQMQGFQMNEIAEEVNIPENTVKQHIFRFRKEMKSKIGEAYFVN